MSAEERGVGSEANGAPLLAADTDEGLAGPAKTGRARRHASAARRRASRRLDLVAGALLAAAILLLAPGLAIVAVVAAVALVVSAVSLLWDRHGARRRARAASSHPARR